MARIIRISGHTSGSQTSSSASSSCSSPADSSPSSSPVPMLDRAAMERRIIRLTKRLNAQEKYLHDPEANLIRKRDTFYRFFNGKARAELAQDLNAFEETTVHRTWERCIELIDQKYCCALKRIPAHQEKMRKLIPKLRMTLCKLSEDYISTFGRNNFLPLAKKVDPYSCSNPTRKLTLNLLNTYDRISAQYYATKAERNVMALVQEDREARKKGELTGSVTYLRKVKILQIPTSGLEQKG